MVNGIGSYNSSMYYLQNQPARTRPDPAEIFNKVDTDASGGISQSELQAMADKTGQTIDTENVISTYDADGDGELSSEEMQSYMESTMQQGMGMMRMQGGGDLFTALDADSSGGVSQTELDEWALNMSEETGNTIDTTDALSTYDTDGDGELSSAELDSFLEASGVPSPATAGMAPPPPPPEASSSEEDDSTTSADSILSKYDTNGDGVLSSTELQAYLDDTSVEDTRSLAQQALSAYASAFGNGRANTMQDLFMNLGGSGMYTPVDYSV